MTKKYILEKMFSYMLEIKSKTTDNKIKYNIDNALYYLRELEKIIN